MGRCNLLDEKWISVMRCDNKVEDVSLTDLFLNAPHYRCLAGDTETQNFAVLRVLLAVIVTVFTRVDAQGVPYEWIELDDRMRPVSSLASDDSDEDERYEYEAALDETWHKIWNAGRFPTVVCSYLEKWRDRFFLLDDYNPFFQVTKKNLEDRLNADKETAALKGKSFAGKQINRLISESNNKEALFSPAVQEFKNHMSEAELARWLITMQGYVGQADKGKFPTAGTIKTSKGWLYDIGGIYMEGSNLFETLMVNSILRFPGEGNHYTFADQRPCWEYEPGERLDEIMSQKPQNNLASIYTIWSRAVYIDPSWSSDKDVFVGAVKLAEISHVDQFLEPMTVWRLNDNGENKDHYTPLKLQPEQAMWRSFGLITLGGEKSRRPIIIDYYHKIKDYLNRRMISLCGVGMLSDANATSWLPIDENIDRLRMNEMLITEDGEAYWSMRISNAVEVTKKVVESIFGAFVYDVALLRGIERTGFAAFKKAALYDAIDHPFREWLANIDPDDNKEKRIREWLIAVKAITADMAQDIIKQADMRDFKVDKDAKKRPANIVIAYNQFRKKLNKEIP